MKAEFLDAIRRRCEECEDKNCAECAVGCYRPAVRYQFFHPPEVTE